MSKNLSEERIRMKKLMGFTYEDNSHDVLSEQLIVEQNPFVNLQPSQSYTPNWGGKNKGSLNFRQPGSPPPPLADGVTRKKYKLYNYSKISKYVTSGEEITTTDQTFTSITLPDYDIGLIESSFNDNQIHPDFDHHTKAKEEFDEIVERLEDYINAGGVENLTNMTIQGSADSAKPTLSGHDHGSNPYDGITNSSKRNQWLSDKRAQNYASLIIKEIKENTGKDITIDVLPGNNYYGQSGKRGLKWRSIEFKSNAPTYTPTAPDPVINKNTEKTETPPTTKMSNATITISGLNKKEEVEGFIYSDDKGYKGPAILSNTIGGWGQTRPVTEDGLWNDKSTTTAHIKGNILNVDGMDIGDFKPYNAGESGIKIDVSEEAPAPTLIAGPITSISFVRKVGDKKYYILRDYWFGLVKS